MKKKELISKLEEVSGELDNFPTDSTIASAIRDLREIQGRLDEIINELEDEDIELEKEEKNES